MSKFFEDVGDFLTGGVRDVAGFITGNPKYNSPGDIWDRSVGPGNALENTFADLPSSQLYNKATGGDLSKFFELPTWDDLGTPGAAFAKNIDTQNQIFPKFFQPYAEPAEAVALSLFNPFAGAALQTAYQGGQEQQQQKGFDWGELGKNAAINFGTAGVADVANKALSAANAAQSSASALNGFNNGASSALQSTADAASANTQGALAAFNTPQAISGASLSSIPQVAGFQSTGQGIQDSAYKAAVEAAKPISNQVLDQTLAPTQTQPISGVFDNFNSSSVAPTTPQLQYGDILNAFGGSSVNTPNPNGPRIGDQDFNDSVSRLAANAYLQEGQARDSALPAGQYQASQNTPYANRLNDINSSTNQSYKDLLDETNNANSYYGIIDSNPGLTTDQLDTYLRNPSSGVLGNFNVTPDAATYLQNIRPLGPINTSLLL